MACPARTADVHLAVPCCDCLLVAIVFLDEALRVHPPLRGGARVWLEAMELVVEVAARERRALRGGLLLLVLLEPLWGLLRGGTGVKPREPHRQRHERRLQHCSRR